MVPGIYTPWSPSSTYLHLPALLSSVIPLRLRWIPSCSPHTPFDPQVFLLALPGLRLLNYSLTWFTVSHHRLPALENNHLNLSSLIFLHLPYHCLHCSPCSLYSLIGTDLCIPPSSNPTSGEFLHALLMAVFSGPRRVLAEERWK